MDNDTKSTREERSKEERTCDHNGKRDREERQHAGTRRKIPHMSGVAVYPKKNCLKPSS